MAVGAVASMGLTGFALPAAAGQTGFNFFGKSIVPQTAAVYNAGALASTRAYSVSFDPAGDMFVGQQEQLVVVAATNKTLFGQQLTKNTPVVFKPGGSKAFTNATYPFVTFDKKGNMFIADESPTDLQVYVVPIETGKIFGQAVTKNTPVLLRPTGNPSIDLRDLGGQPCQMAFDKKGNLFIASYSGGSAPSGSVVVVPKKTATIFGQSFKKNAPASLTGSQADGVEAVAFDKKGNLFVGNYSSSTVKVLAKKNATIFGTARQKNTWSEVTTATNAKGSLNWLRFDQQGNLFMGFWDTGDMEVLPNVTGTVFGESVTANQLVSFGRNTLSQLFADSPSFDFSPGGALVVAGDAPSAPTVVLAP